MLKIQSFILAAIMAVVSMIGSIQLALDPTVNRTNGYYQYHDITMKNDNNNIINVEELIL